MNKNRLMFLIGQKFLSLMNRVKRRLPARFQLPFMARVYSIYGGEPEIKWLKKIGPCRGMAVDVGANEGFYSLALTQLYSKVVAFEPNKKVAAPLIAAALPGVEIIHQGLSSKSEVAVFYIPSVKGMSLPGWGSLDKHNCPDASAVETQEINLCALDSFGFSNVGFIKIDVEGHEIEVLRGAAETIQREHPHLLVEVKDQNLPEVRNLLSGWGYQEFTLSSFVGPTGTPENHIFLPG